MSAWWVIWGVALVLPVIAALVELRRKPRQRWRYSFGGTPTPLTFALFLLALICLMASGRNLSESTAGYATVGFSNLIASFAIISWMGWRHNTKLARFQ